jgi:hypothetical protein
MFIPSLSGGLHRAADDARPKSSKAHLEPQVASAMRCANVIAGSAGQMCLRHLDKTTFAKLPEIAALLTRRVVGDDDGCERLEDKTDRDQ